MEKIMSREDYVSLIHEVKGRFSSVETNCLIPGSGMEPWIRAGQLYAEKVPEGLEIFVDEGSYRTLYYHIGSGERFPAVCNDVPVIAEETFRAGAGEAKAREMGGRIREAGFLPYRENRMFAADPAEVTARCEEERKAAVRKLAGQGITLTGCADDAQRDQVLALWDSCLECGDVPLSHRYFREDPVQNVLLAVHRDGRVAGTYWWKDSRKGACEGRHLVTDPADRGMGIASALLLVSMEQLAGRGIRQLSTWINRTNEGSLRLHGRLGFRANGRECIQYIKKGEERC